MCFCPCFTRNNECFWTKNLSSLVAFVVFGFIFFMFLWIDFCVLLLINGVEVETCRLLVRASVCDSYVVCGVVAIGWWLWGLWHQHWGGVAGGGYRMMATTLVVVIVGFNLNVFKRYIFSLKGILVFLFLHLNK